MIAWFKSSQAEKASGAAVHKYDSLAHKFVHGVNYLLAKSSRIYCSDSILGIAAVASKDTPCKQHAVVLAKTQLLMCTGVLPLGFTSGIGLMF